MGNRTFPCKQVYSLWGKNKTQNTLSWSRNAQWKVSVARGQEYRSANSRRSREKQKGKLETWQAVGCSNSAEEEVHGGQATVKKVDKFCG